MRRRSSLFPIACALLAACGSGDGASGPSDDAANRLQQRLAEVDGVESARLTIEGDRARARLRVVSRDSGVHAVRKSLRLLVDGLDARRIGVRALDEPANPVIANWDARTERAFVQALPNPPVRYALRR